jgi:ABC-type uncharacterized transport system YnjBCD ATPase subunit
MRLLSRALTILLIVTFAMPRIGAQQLHVVDTTAVQRALDQRAADSLAKRQVIRTALQQPDVVKVANQLGLEAARVDAAVAALDGAELDRLAAQAEVVNDALSGGQTARVNLLWVIIGLLVLILIIVAVD